MSAATPEEMGAAPQNQQPKSNEYAELSAAFNPADQQELKRAGAALNVLSLGKWQALENIAVFAMAVLGVVTVTIEVFIRHKFGERYLTFVRIGLGWFAMGTLGQLGALGGLFSGARAGVLAGGLLFFFVSILAVLVGFYHMRKIAIRNQKREAWYSYSFGLSILQKLPFLAGIHEWTFYRFIEPSIVMVIGIVFAVASVPAFAWWLIVGGFLMFIRNNAAYTTTRGIQLDVGDSQIMQAFATPIMDGEPPQEAGGYAGIAVPRPIVKRTPRGPLTPETVQEGASLSNKKAE